ncbi:hypothetical protein NLJ89_g7501 [Agrocybe chaxingu]|uniref:Uncharacterized protein n=1 Tax=Agrocybe chaxingu TaxID=84603 RepID=A0A9W8JZ30_9AGAR|nr:hypothetical protein NLJ89_g7501 [Agrocybe chaxingu]
MVPSVASFPQAPSQGQPQPSPTIPNNVPRRSSPLGQVTRLLPTPPHNNPPNFQEDRRSPPPPTQSNVNSHYPRPAPRAPIAAYPAKFQSIDDHWHMTEELLADIERADQQQAQYQSQVQSYPSGPRNDSPVGRPPNVERVRAAAERASPTAQHRGREQVARESPKNRQPGSPIVASFGQLQSSTPERRMSPQLPADPHPASYLAQYSAREAPPLRRAPNSDPQRLNTSMASQTPPLQAIAARTPDRSLPVQEEDEVTSKNGSGAHSNWQASDQVDEHPFHSSSPTPSSDLNPDGTAQRFEPTAQAVRRDDEKGDEDRERSQYAERDSTEESGGFTPRSPTAQLPDDTREPYYPNQNIPIRVPAPLPARKGRNGSGDQIMRGLDSALLDRQPQQHAPPPSSAAQQPPPSERPPKYAEQRQAANGGQNESLQYPKYVSQQDYAYNPEPLPHGSNGRYVPPQVYPDDFHSYGEESTSAYINAYFHSSRPDAPVPPTPHSQTAAPSPSPFMGNMPHYRSPAPTAGSPYPYPFNHVRRKAQSQTQRLLQNGLDPATIQEQVARQWQIFAQNNQGNITDSTLSPTSTPFQAGLYDHWAHLHTNKMMRGMLETASMHSSPSHQPIPLPMFDFAPRKKDRGAHAKRAAYTRKPPPRVESTQPRETSPELSSSGEETAGEERLDPTPDVLPFAAPREPAQVPLPNDSPDVDEEGEWVDEEDEDDYDDLIELEYHPAFVKNVSKRRRKWEVGWENLIQAFQTLDRQTDATMVLLASPSHTTKLHMLRSRSIRRQPALASSTTMKELRSNFARMAALRRTTRPQKSSLVDRLQASALSTSGGDGSDGSSSQESLRRALDAALGSLSAMGEVYEQREARVLEELQRSREDYERMELLLKQVLGDKNPLKSSANREP